MIILPNDDPQPNNARIGWQSIVSAATVGASEQAGDHPVLNLKNPATYLFWRGTTSAAHTITVTPAGAPPTIDYLGIARHNLALKQYTLQSSPDNSVWTTIVSATPADNRPIIHVFPPVTAPFFRLQIASGSPVSQIAVLYLGRILTLERRLMVGHTPLPFGRSRDVSSGVSESGQYLGRVKRAETLETKVTMQNLTAEHYRDDIDPFFDAAATTPFFWAWRPDRRPGDVGFAWMKGEPSMVNQRNNGMVEIDFQMQGLA
jgi:hypothetical protein